MTTPSFFATISTGTICKATLLVGINEGLSTPSKYVDLKLKNARQRGITADPFVNGFTIKMRIFLSQLSFNVANPRPGVSNREHIRHTKVVKCILICSETNLVI